MDPADPLLPKILVLVILILINAFFAAAEIAVISLSETKLRKQAEEGDKKAKKLLVLMQAPDSFLSAIQIAITLAGFLSSAFAADSFSDPLVHWLTVDKGFTAIPTSTLNTIMVVLITIVLSYFSLVLGELVPKRIAMKKTEAVARFTVGAVTSVAAVFRPVIWLLSKSTNGVLRALHIDPKADEEDVSEDEIRSLPKYAYTDSSSLEVSSDYHDLPQDLIMLLQARSPFGSNSQYRFSTGIDTSFPVRDAFADASQEYNERRENSIIGLTLLIISSLSFIVSLALLIAWTGHGAEKSDRKAHLFPFDHLPVELRMLIGALWGLIAFLVTPVFLSSLENILGVIDSWSFWENCIRFLADYFVALPLTLSIVRSFKAGRLWADSLLNGIAGLIGHYIHAAEKTSPKIFTYVLFVLPNLLAAGMVVTLFAHFFQAQSLRAFLSALGIVIIILAIDCYAWRIATGLSQAVDEQVKAERLKADLITNVSHDLKTPLTSIISYVDLLKRENIDNPNVQEYLKVLDQKSTRLKTLTEDLVEASKASSGNVKIDFADINYTEIVEQALGEFEDKTSAAKLEMVLSYPEHPVMIRADGRHLWRVIENLLNNCCKYALRGSRVYVDVTEDPETGTAACTIKNISSRPLNISPEELTERFVRGDVSRTTEGSGLGLSIAKSLAELQHGTLDIFVDGDLFKVVLRLPTVR